MDEKVISYIPDEYGGIYPRRGSGSILPNNSLCNGQNKG
jgi:hypothetical protein